MDKLKLSAFCLGTGTTAYLIVRSIFGDSTRVVPAGTELDMNPGQWPKKTCTTTIPTEFDPQKAEVINGVQNGEDMLLVKTLGCNGGKYESEVYKFPTVEKFQDATELINSANNAQRSIWATPQP